MNPRIQTSLQRCLGFAVPERGVYVVKGTTVSVTRRVRLRRRKQTAMRMQRLPDGSWHRELIQAALRIVRERFWL